MQFAAEVVKMTRYFSGSALRLLCVCSAQHCEEHWLQGKLGEKREGNVVAASALYTTGNSYTKVRSFMNLAGIAFFSHETYYLYQNGIFNDVAQQECERELSRVRATALASGEPLHLAGDGRFDSPGHSARLSTYTLMDTKSRKVICSNSMETKATTSSPASEIVLLKKCLDELKEDYNLTIATVTTDGNRSAAKAVESFGITHQLDVWHGVKNFAKHMVNNCRTKEQKKLVDWVPDLTNQIWDSTSNCGKDPDVLLEMIKSMAFHILNIHSGFPCHEKFRKCAHDPLDRK